MKRDPGTETIHEIEHASASNIVDAESRERDAMSQKAGPLECPMPYAEYISAESSAFPKDFFGF